MNKLKEGLTRYFTKEQLKKISNTRIFIAGCGGLGSNIAHMLTRCGFLHFTILDFDIVENSNLNRQFFFPDQTDMLKIDALEENLRHIEPDLEIKKINKKISSEAEIPKLISESDIIIEAFDSPESKILFIRGALASNKPVIGASGIAGYGNTDAIRVRKMGNHLYIVGDEISGNDTLPPLAPRVNAAAAKQADLALELTLKS